MVVGGTENDLEALATDQASAILNPGAGLQDGGRPERSADSDAESGADLVLGEKRTEIVGPRAGAEGAAAAVMKDATANTARMVLWRTAWSSLW